MQTNYIEPIIKQFQYDIIVGYKHHFLNKGIRDPQDFKREMTGFLANCADTRQEKNIPAKFLNRAYKQINSPDVVSGETLCIHLLKQLMGNSFNKKTTEEKITYCHEILNNLFYKVTSSTVSLYAGSILEGKNQDKIKDSIAEEINSYFDEIKSQYMQKYPSLNFTDETSNTNYIGSSNSNSIYSNPLLSPSSMPIRPHSSFDAAMEEKKKDYEAKYRLLKEQIKGGTNKPAKEVSVDKLDSFF